MYIYRTFQTDSRYITPREVNKREFSTEQEAIEHLENNGGGYYRNILHNFDLWIDGTKPGDPRKDTPEFQALVVASLR